MIDKNCLKLSLKIKKIKTWSKVRNLKNNLLEEIRREGHPSWSLIGRIKILVRKATGCPIKSVNIFLEARNLDGWDNC